MTLSEKLKPYVSEIVSAHQAGDKAATQIITLYEMHRRSPSDPGAPAFCEATFDVWLRARAALSEVQEGRK